MVLVFKSLLTMEKVLEDLMKFARGRFQWEGKCIAVGTTFVLKNNQEGKMFCIAMSLSKIIVTIFILQVIVVSAQWISQQLQALNILAMLRF